MGQRLLDSQGLCDIQDFRRVGRAGEGIPWGKRQDVTPGVQAWAKGAAQHPAVGAGCESRPDGRDSPEKMTCEPHGCF